MSNKEVAILFSGGLDSTAVASQYLVEGKTVELLTFMNGAQKWLNLAERKAEMIVQVYPNQCSSLILDCTYLFHELAIASLEEDVKNYGNLICVGCKFAMLAEVIVYCRMKNISVLADGFRRAQNYYPEQTPQFINIASELASSYGISYIHPLYDCDDCSTEDIALSASIPTSPMQAYCLFERNHVGDPSFVSAYLQGKLSNVRNYIERRIKYIGESGS